MSSDELVVITSFPEKGLVHGKAVVGIASYAKNTLLSLKSYKKNIKIFVLAEKLNGKEEYEDDNLEVKRVWKRNSFSIFPALLKQILSLKSKNILVEFEIAMFGDLLFLIPLPLFLLLLALTRKKITIVLHQVISDITELSGHINIKSRTKLLFLNLMIGIFYRTIISLSSKVIVFDEILKKKLEKLGKADKIIVIEHGVEKFNVKITKDEAKRKLNLSKNEAVILYFGFLAWYKGTDFLVNNYRKNKGIKLIIAGGPNPNHINKAYYQSYVDKIQLDCLKKGILLTGFVQEEDIPTYFSACDAVILPYRTLMSASGPLSIAFSFAKPIFVSEKLSGIFETKDLSEALQKRNILKESLMFDSYADLEAKIEKLRDDKAFAQELREVSAEIAKKRDWNIIGKKYYEEIFN